MVAVFKNNASTFLAEALSSTAVSVAVEDGSVFPTLVSGEFFNATIQGVSNNKEIVQVTAVAGNTLYFTRAQEDTLAIPFVSGSRIELRTTKENLSRSLINGDYLIL